MLVVLPKVYKSSSTVVLVLVLVAVAVAVVDQGAMIFVIAVWKNIYFHILLFGIVATFLFSYGENNEYNI